MLMQSYCPAVTNELAPLALQPPNARVQAPCPPLVTAALTLNHTLGQGRPLAALEHDARPKRSLVMRAQCLELTGFSNSTLERLEALGLFLDVIAWKRRLFVATGPDRGPLILAALLARNPRMRVAAAGSVRTAA
jgi:hypothetical protein